MADEPARLRRTSHDQIVIVFARFEQDLVQNNAVPNPNFSLHPHFFEILFLT